MSFVAGDWEGHYVDMLTKVNFEVEGTFLTADALAFVAYWSSTLTKTLPANSTIANDDGTPNSVLTIVCDNRDDLTVHQKVVDDIQTSETALLARAAAITTANTTADTYATGKIAYAILV